MVGWPEAGRRAQTMTRSIRYSHDTVCRSDVAREQPMSAEWKVGDVTSMGDECLFFCKYV